MKTLLACTLAALSLVATPAAAATIVDTGPGNPAPSAVVGPTLATFGQFQLTEEVLIKGLEFYGNVPVGGTATFGIWADNNGSPFFNIFAEQVELPTTTTAGWYGDISLNNGDGYTLFAGTYWISFYNGGGAMTANHFGGAPNGLDKEFQFTPLPIASFVPIDSVDLAWRITGDVATQAAPVPEPSTWAMLLLGFGAAGFMLRRSRRGAGTIIGQIA
jgi:hypothetical protein